METTKPDSILEKAARLRGQIAELELELRVVLTSDSTESRVYEIFEEIDRIREGGFTLGDMSLQDAIACGRR